MKNSRTIIKKSRKRLLLMGGSTLAEKRRVIIDQDTRVDRPPRNRIARKVKCKARWRKVQGKVGTGVHHTRANPLGQAKSGRALSAQRFASSLPGRAWGSYHKGSSPHSLAEGNCAHRLLRPDV